MFLHRMPHRKEDAYMKSKNFNLIVNLIGLAMVIFILVMLFVPYFTYPHVVTVNDPRVSGPIGNGLTETLTELKTKVDDDVISIAHYAWVPSDVHTAGRDAYLSEQFPGITITNGSFAIPVAAIMLCGLAAIAITVIKLKTKVPSILFALFGIIGVWAFLSMPPFALGKAGCRIPMEIVSVLLAVGGIAYVVLYLREKTGEVFNIVANLICAVLLIALIFVMFPANQNGTVLTFSVRNAGTTPETNPYLIEPVKDYFGTYTYPNPMVLLIIALIVLAVSLLKCTSEWPLFLQVFAGVIGIYTLLTNPAFDADIPAAAGGLAACLLLTGIGLVRLAIFSMNRLPANIATCNYLACVAFLIVGVMLFTTTWTIDVANKGGQSHASIMEVSTSIYNIEKDQESPAKKAAGVVSKMNAEIKANGQYINEYKNEEMPVKYDAESIAWVGHVLMIIALAGIALNIVLKEKFYSGIINIVLGVAGAWIFAAVKPLHFSGKYLISFDILAVVVILGVMILLAALLGRKPQNEDEEVAIAE